MQIRNFFLARRKAVSSREKRNKRKAVLKLAERELLLKDLIRFHNESAELDLSKTRKLSKNHEDFHCHWEIIWNLLKNEVQINYVNNKFIKIPKSVGDFEEPIGIG